MVNFNSTMPLTISFLFLYLPLKFHFSSLSLFYFFHCLLLPLHFPINSSLIVLFKTHFIFLAIHIFHSLVPKIFKTSRRRWVIYTITTSPYSTSSSSSSSSPQESRPWVACFQGFKGSWSSSSSCFPYGVVRLYSLISLMSSSLLLIYLLY